VAERQRVGETKRRRNRETERQREREIKNIEKCILKFNILF
jgi:hypothetical protein